jgi:hypothetical protein
MMEIKRVYRKYDLAMSQNKSTMFRSTVTRSRRGWLLSSNYLFLYSLISGSGVIYDIVAVFC